MKCRFKFTISFSLFCLFFFILFCALGIWQLHRYDYKKILLTTYERESQSTPIPFLELKNPSSFQPVSVRGHYKNELTMLIQNRFYKNQLGYEVLTPLELPSQKKLLLVDRGWKALPLGQLSPISEEQTISGYIKLTNEYQFILGKNILEPDKFPLVMQKIDLDEITRLTNYTFYPFVLRLSSSEKNGFVRDWPIVTVEPKRHLGYAVQWFLMAILLLIAYFCFCCERINSNDSQ